MSELGQIMDHAAQLQQRVDRLELELSALAIAAIGLAVGLMILTWRLWQQ
jgi:hypothetical protein